MEQPTPILTIQDLTVTAGGEPLLQDLSLTVRSGEILVIVGESGSGKTTLLKAVGGLLSPGLSWQGHIQTVPPQERDFLFQDAASSFCPVRTVLDQLWDAARFAGEKDYTAFLATAEQRASVLDLPPHSLDAYPQEFSGGMIQRAELLFPLIHAPKLLLADEPTSAVDSVTQKKMADALLRLRRYHQTAILLVTHDIRLARYLADTLVVLKNGRTIEYGTAANLLAEPQQDYTKHLLQKAGLRKENAHAPLYTGPDKNL